MVIQQSLTISIVIQQRNNKKKQNPERLPESGERRVGA